MPGGSIFNSMDDELEDVNSQEEDDLLAQEEQFDAELAEAEHRFNLGNYYRRLAQGGLFKDGSAAAKIVDDEVRAFARERMAVLLNLPSAPKAKADLPFTPEQISRLQQLAGLTDDQVSILHNLANRYAEKLGRPTAPSPAVPTPVTPAPIAKPSVPVMQTLSSPTSTPQPTRVPKPKKPKDEVKAKVDYTKIADGEIFMEGGKHWKFVTIPGSNQRVKMGVNLKNQVRPPGALPPPSPAQESMMSEQQAMMQVTRAPVVQSDITRTIGKE